MLQMTSCSTAFQCTQLCIIFNAEDETATHYYLCYHIVASVELAHQSSNTNPDQDKSSHHVFERLTSHQLMLDC